MLNKKSILVNSVFAQDAGPPGYPTNLAFLKAKIKGANWSATDLDIHLYNELERDINTYHFIQYLFGGFPFSYPLTGFLDFNEYPFEALSSLNLLLALAYSGDYSKELEHTTAKFGLDYDNAANALEKFLKIFNGMVNELAEYNLVIISCTSPAAVFFSILAGFNIKGKNSEAGVIAIGNDINIPEVAEFALTINAFDYIFGMNDSELLEYLESRGLCTLDFSSRLPDCSDFQISDYPLSSGLQQVSLCSSTGCPHKCNFCSERIIWNRQGAVCDSFAMQPLDDTLNQIQFFKEKLKISRINFTDCMLNADQNRLKNLLKELEPLNMMFGAAVRVDRLNGELLDLMSKAGFVKLVLGVETVNPRSVKIYNKGNDAYSTAVFDMLPKVYRSNIDPRINVLICHPYESLGDVKQAVIRMSRLADNIKKNNFHFYDAPVGTVCLNYPSKIYFKVLNDSDFMVHYQYIPDSLKANIPPAVIQAVKKIPDKAVRKSTPENSGINKLDFCNSLYNLWSDDNEGVLQQKVTPLITQRIRFHQTWIQNGIQVEKYRSFDPGTKENSQFRKVCSVIPDSGSVLYKDILKNQEDIGMDEVVPVLLTLSTAGLIKFIQTQ